MMRNLLLSMGAAQWMLPALLVVPVVSALLVRLLGRDVSRDETGGEAPSGGPDARVLTLAALGVEAVLGLMLWICFDPAVAGRPGRHLQCGR